LPAATFDVSSTNGVSFGWPPASRCATRVMLAPSGTSASSTLRIALPIGCPGGVSAMSYRPGGRSSGPATCFGWKFCSVRFPLTYTSTGVPGMPCTTDTFALAAWAGDVRNNPLATTARPAAANILTRRIVVPPYSRDGLRPVLRVVGGLPDAIRGIAHNPHPARPPAS